MTLPKTDLTEAIGILDFLCYDIWHQVHTENCKCNYAVRKLRHAIKHLRGQLSEK